MHRGPKAERWVRTYGEMRRLVHEWKWKTLFRSDRYHSERYCVKVRDTTIQCIIDNMCPCLTSGHMCPSVPRKHSGTGGEVLRLMPQSTTCNAIRAQQTRRLRPWLHSINGSTTIKAQQAMGPQENVLSKAIFSLLGEEACAYLHVPLRADKAVGGLEVVVHDVPLLHVLEHGDERRRRARDDLQREPPRV